MWIEILNKSFKGTVEIKQNQPLGFPVIEPEHLKFRYVMGKKKKNTDQENLSTYKPKTKEATWRFLNCYDFAYVGRDTVNQAAKVAPGVIKAATDDINNIAKDRINQIIFHGGKEVERVLPKILRGAIEDVYQMPVRLFGNFGKQQLNKMKRKILH